MGPRRNSLHLARLFGIDLRIDTSWLLIFALVIWSLTSLFASWHPDWGLPTSMAVATAAALAFFASVLFHELAHSLVARLYGIPVRDITLHMFGGVSNIEREPPTPGAEFFIAIVGPIASVGLGIVMMLLVGLGASVAPGDVESATEAMLRMGPVTTALMWLGPINVLVGLFNLVPGFPLDGGRILRSVLWKITGDLHKATIWAAGAGQIVGWGFVAMGVMMVLGYRVPVFGRGLVGGLWLGMIGLFLRNAAVQYRTSVAVSDALSGMHVADMMRTHGATVPAELSARALVEQWFMRRGDGAYPVFAGDSFVGLVALEDVRRVEPEEWDVKRVRDVMTPAPRLVTTAPGDEVTAALQKLGATGVAQLPVLEGGRLVGMLYEQDVARWLALESARRRAGPRRVPRHA